MDALSAPVQYKQKHQTEESKWKSCGYSLLSYVTVKEELYCLPSCMNSAVYNNTCIQAFVACVCVCVNTVHMNVSKGRHLTVVRDHFFPAWSNMKRRDFRQLIIVGITKLLLKKDRLEETESFSNFHVIFIWGIEVEFTSMSECRVQMSLSRLLS